MPIEAATTPCSIAVAIDVSNLEKSCGFYARLLGFEQVGVERAGLIYESRALRSSRFPGVELRLRAAFGKRPFGSCAGGLLSLTLPVPDLRAAVNALRGQVRWRGPEPAEPPQTKSVEFIDPDGYVLCLAWADRP